jgi:hypothetical protein
MVRYWRICCLFLLFTVIVIFPSMRSIDVHPLHAYTPCNIYCIYVCMYLCIMYVCTRSTYHIRAILYRYLRTQYVPLMSVFSVWFSCTSPPGHRILRPRRLVPDFPLLQRPQPT